MSLLYFLSWSKELSKSLFFGKSAKNDFMKISSGLARKVECRGQIVALETNYRSAFLTTAGKIHLFQESHISKGETETSNFLKLFL